MIGQSMSNDNNIYITIMEVHLLNETFQVILSEISSEISPCSRNNHSLICILTLPFLLLLLLRAPCNLMWLCFLSYLLVVPLKLSWIKVTLLLSIDVGVDWAFVNRISNY